MLVWKAAPLLLLVLAAGAGADKKIELQDIEEDNLKSENEKQNESDQDEQRQSTGSTGPSRLFAEEFFKSGLPLIKYFENVPPQPRFVQQYDVTEQPETRSGPSAPSAPSGPAPQPQYGVPPATQQALVGYLSNIPMQVYLVPQSEAGEQEAPSLQATHYASGTASPQATQYTAVPAGLQATHYASGPASPQAMHYTAGTASPQAPHYTAGSAGPQAPHYTVGASSQNTQFIPPGNNKIFFTAAPEAVQHANYVEMPTAYAKTFFPSYTSPAYVTYAPQTNLVPAHSTVGPLIAYQIPVTQYSAASPPAMAYIKYYGKNNDVSDAEDVIESPKHYASQTEAPYTKPTHSEYPRYYNSRAPIKEDHRHAAISEIPPPNPLILKNPPPHLAHLPKALPMVRPLSRYIYSPNNYIPRPHEPYPSPLKRRPSSLLDSYVPSGLQLEYMKRGYTKDPPQAYEALSRVHQYYKQFGMPMPKEYERGFLPNQMYHTAAGGITYGHYKRNAKGAIARQK